MLQPLDFPYYLELQKRLEEAFLFVACNEKNFGTHSIKIENLFVDNCAFFESLIQSFVLELYHSGHKFIYQSQITDFQKKIDGHKHFSIADYRVLLENEFDLAKKELNLNSYEEDYFGNPQAIILPAKINGYKIRPLEKWNDNKNPLWWNAFTKLKHNRLKNIKRATLKNLINSVGATFLILTIKNEKQFKLGKVPEEIYNVFYPKYWTFKGRASRGVVKWH